jgi:hypothetical protein
MVKLRHLAKFCTTRFCFGDADRDEKLNVIRQDEGVLKRALLISSGLIFDSRVDRVQLVWRRWMIFGKAEVVRTSFVQEEQSPEGKNTPSMCRDQIENGLQLRLKPGILLTV